MFAAADCTARQTNSQRGQSQFSLCGFKENREGQAAIPARFLAMPAVS